MDGPDTLLVLVPAFNEAERLPEVLADLAAALELPYEAVVIDDRHGVHLTAGFGAR